MDIEVRALTRGQVKELRKAGLDLVYLGKAEKNDMVELCEWILDNVYADVNTDDIPYDEALDLATATYKRTYGKEEASKN